MEIGSEFFLTDIENGNNIVLADYNNIQLFDSGRSAIEALLIVLKKKFPGLQKALLPAYLCDSIIYPFESQNIICDFYDFSFSSTFTFEELENKLDQNDIIYFVDYFGFPVSDKMNHLLMKASKNGKIVIHDKTHSLFSKKEQVRDSFYYVGSLRKWMGIPSGGFSSNIDVDFQFGDSSDNSFWKIRKNALQLKKEYKDSDYQNKKLKLDAMTKFNDAEHLLDTERTIFNMDEESICRWSKLDVDSMIHQRRENYEVLLRGLENVPDIKILFPILSEGICPLFFPIIYSSRKELQTKLAESSIYCPIHWPIPKQVEVNKYPYAKDIYNNILSIPCDQRYTVSDMNKIVNKIKEVLC